MSDITMPDYKLKTMEDLHDHAAEHREKILPARGMIASVEFDIEAIRERLKKAADKLAEAEALTPGFESKATSGTAKSQERAEQQYGAHLVAVSKLRAELATIQAEADAKLPALNDELDSAKGHLRAITQFSAYGAARNHWQLLLTRLSDSNVGMLTVEFLRAAQAAGVYLTDNDKALLTIFDPKTEIRVGPYQGAISFRPERFDPEPETADPELLPIIDEVEAA